MHTNELSNILEGFELYILGRYDDFMEQERRDDIDYGTGIGYYDNLEDFYSWLDMQSWNDMREWVEEYGQQLIEMK